eukprot:3323859-Pleurochrysis_carterae.AAC.4
MLQDLKAVEYRMLHTIGASRKRSRVVLRQMSTGTGVFCAGRVVADARGAKGDFQLRLRSAHLKSI